MLTKLLVRCGLTRDSMTFVVLKVVGIAGLVTGGFVDVHGWLLYLGLNASDITVHRIIAIAGLISLIGGQYSTSSLPSKAELQTVTLPKEKTA